MITRIRIWFRNWYEAQIALPHGIMQFVANVVFCQPGRNQYLQLTPPCSRMGEIKVTCKDMRPLLQFIRWDEQIDISKTEPWKLPVYQVIVELEKFQLRKGQAKEGTEEIEWGEWEPIPTRNKHPVIQSLRDLFLAHAFYNGIRKEHLREDLTV